MPRRVRPAKASAATEAVGRRGEEVDVPAFESDKRDFVRVKVAVGVRYKFLGQDFDDSDLGKIWEGTTSNLSGGGLLLRGRIPRIEWLAPLLSGRLRVGVNLVLPTYELPVKALTRVAWIEDLEESSQKASMGLTFQEITREAREEVLKYIIKTQMPG